MLTSGFSSSLLIFMWVLASAGFIGVMRNETLLASVPELTVSTGVSLLALVIGAAAALYGIGRPSLVFGALLNPGSRLFNEFAAFFLTVLFAVLYLTAIHRFAKVSHCLIYARLTALFSLILVATVALSFVMPWKAAWGTYWLIPPFVAWALYAACVLSSLVHRYENSAVRLTLLAAVALEISIALYFGAVQMQGPEEAVFMSAVSGDAALPFWLSQIVGIALPLLVSCTVRSRPVSIVSGLLVAVGAGCYQWMILLLAIPGQSFF